MLSRIQTTSKSALNNAFKYVLSPLADGVQGAGAIYAISELIDEGFNADLKGGYWYYPMAAAMLATGGFSLVKQVSQIDPALLKKIDGGLQFGIEAIEECMLLSLFVNDAIKNAKGEEGQDFFFLIEAGAFASAGAIVLARALYYRQQYSKTLATNDVLDIQTTLIGNNPQPKTVAKEFFEGFLLEPLSVSGIAWGVAELVAETEVIPEEAAIIVGLAALPLPLIKKAIERKAGKSENADRFFSHAGELLLGAIFPIALLMYTYAVATDSEEIPNAYFVFAILAGLAIGANRSYALSVNKPYKLPVEITDADDLDADDLSDSSGVSLP